ASPPTVINRYDVSPVISVVIGVNTGATMPPNDFGTTDTVTSADSAAYTTGSRMRNSAVSIATPCFIALDPGSGGAMRPGRPYTTRDLPPTDTESGARRPGPSRRPSRHARPNSDTAALAAAATRAPGDDQRVTATGPESHASAPARDPAPRGHPASPVRKPPKSNPTSVKNNPCDVSPTVTPP